ncbi:MAG: sulfatase, partial [Opitutus sp.]
VGLGFAFERGCIRILSIVFSMLPRPLFAALILFVAVASSAGAERLNVLFIAIDDLRNDLGALGDAAAKTPNLDRLAASGRLFTHHYAIVPTCGASRCALLRGRYPDRPAQITNEAILLTHDSWGDRSMPAWWRAHGYRTLSLGKVSHFPGNYAGKNWAGPPEELPHAWDRAWIPAAPWPHAEGMMHGFANGRPRQLGRSPAWEAFDGPDDAYPDYWVAREAVDTLRDLATSSQPWFFAVGLFKPHLPFAAPKKWFGLHPASEIPVPAVTAQPAEPSSWHPSDELRKNYADAAGRDPATSAGYAMELRRAYRAATSYVDDQVGKLMQALHELDLDDRTIVVVWSDHGYLLGEHAIWGKHSLYENALRSPLIVRSPGLNRRGAVSDALVEAVDIYPTLLELCGLPSPGPLDGRSLRANLDNPDTKTVKPARGFWTNGERTLRTDRWRLIAHPGKPNPSGNGGGVELFDVIADPDESRNVAAAEPEVVRTLLGRLDEVPAISSAARLRQ